MKNKKEIRNLLAGVYEDPEDGDCSLHIFKADEGVHIINADIDLGIYYHWIIDPAGNVVYFELEDIEEVMQGLNDENFDEAD